MLYVCVCVSVFDLDEKERGNTAFLTGISSLAQSLHASSETAQSHSFSHLGQLRARKPDGILPGLSLKL